MITTERSTPTSTSTRPGSKRTTDTITDQPPHGHEHATPPGPDALRPRGRRLTRQRKLVWAALTAEPDQHLSAEDVATRVQAELPSVNLSTVYRNLELLVDEGLARRTELGRDRAFYEPAHEHPHHHLVCEHCEHVTHVHTAMLGDLARSLHATAHFQLSDREVTLFGVCARCAQSPDAT